MKLEELLDELEYLFSDCLTGYDVNRFELCKSLERYKSAKSDWAQYVFRDDLRYTRNLVKKGELYEVILMRWGEGHATSVHSHCGCHCAMKVLEGQIKETVFEFPKQKKCALKELSVNCLETEGVTYISDELGLHRLENPSAFEEAITLHVYIPAFDWTNRYDERTGKRQKIALTFTSKEGQKVQYGV